MVLLVKMPRSQDEVPLALATVRAELERIAEQKKAAETTLEAIQEFCIHPTKEKRDFPDGVKKVCMVCCKVGC